MKSGISKILESTSQTTEIKTNKEMKMETWKTTQLEPVKTEQVKTLSDIDKLKMDLSHFVGNVEVAQSGGWVETTKEVMMHYNPKGLNGAKYFVYKGRKVCELGKIDEIEKEMDENFGENAWTKKPTTA